MMAFVVMLINRRKRMIGPTNPNYFESGGLKGFAATDATHIENIPRRVIYGRLVGFSLPGQRLVLRFGRIYWDRVERFGNPQPDDQITRAIGRFRLIEADIVPDSPRGNSSAGILSQFMVELPVMSHGL